MSTHHAWTHGVPLRICRTADDPGFGYHRLHAAWSTSGTACPGNARVTQFHAEVFPGILACATGTSTAPQEDTMPTVEEIWAARISQGDSGPKAASTYLVSAHRNATAAMKAANEAVAQVGALAAAITALAESGGLDAAEVQAAADAGARAALDQLGQALTEEG